MLVKRYKCGTLQCRQLANGAFELSGLAAPYERFALVDDAEFDDVRQTHTRAREKIAAGAFERVIHQTLTRELNVLGLVDHQPTLRLADTNNNMQLSSSKDGLHFAMQIKPDSFARRAVIADAQAGKLTGVSIGFNLDRANRRTPKPLRPLPQTGKGVYVQEYDANSRTSWRVLKDVDLKELSILTEGNQPAYGGTHVQLA